MTFLQVRPGAPQVRPGTTTQDRCWVRPSLTGRTTGHTHREPPIPFKCAPAAGDE
jgi:hypothetical protein